MSAQGLEEQLDNVHDTFAKLPLYIAKLNAMKNTIASVTVQSRKLKRRADQVAVGREKQAVKSQAARAKEQAYDQTVAAVPVANASPTTTTQRTESLRNAYTVWITQHQLASWNTLYSSSISNNHNNGIGRSVRTEPEESAIDIHVVNSSTFPSSSKTSISDHFQHAASQWFWITPALSDPPKNVSDSGCITEWSGYNRQRQRGG
ncbi:hypothetical protein BGZ72_010689 [Mortierella alpina]|nr:hypothetical protein BGZ72_010689 [Mortierella alpina]